MLLEVKLRLTSPFLGSKPPDDASIRRLVKNGKGIMFPVDTFKQDVLTAISVTGVDAHPQAIYAPIGFTSPSLHLYRRTYSAFKVDLFESIRTGTILTLEMGIDTGLKPAMSVDAFNTIMAWIGEQKGISQFGSKFGFGKFRVVTLQPVNSECNQANQDPQPDPQATL